MIGLFNDDDGPNIVHVIDFIRAPSIISMKRIIKSVQKGEKKRL